MSDPTDTLAAAQRKHDREQRQALSLVGVVLLTITFGFLLGYQVGTHHGQRTYISTTYVTCAPPTLAVGQHVYLTCTKEKP